MNSPLEITFILFLWFPKLHILKLRYTNDTEFGCLLPCSFAHVPYICQEVISNFLLFAK